MMFPPSILGLRIARRAGQRHVGLWIPLFLLWPFVLLALVVAVPLLLVAALFWPGARLLLRCLPGLAGVACALRGLKVDVTDRDHRVYVRIV